MFSVVERQAMWALLGVGAFVLGSRWTLGRLLRTLLAALIMGGFTWLAKMLGVPFGALIAVGAVTYVAAVGLLRVLSLTEIRAVLRKEPIAP